MDDLVAFLRDQLARDEQSARAMTHAVGEVRSRWSPDRLLQEVAAKRRIIDDVVPDVRGLEDRIESEWGCGGHAGYEESETLLRLLALPFAANPACREEWKP